jgi:hypothetical protein
MTRWVVLVAMAGLVAGCAQELPPSAFHPARADFARGLPKSYALKGRVKLGKVTSGLPKGDKVTPEGYAPALEKVLGQAGVLAAGKPDYILHAKLLKYREPSADGMHGAGAVVQYRLVSARSGRQVYSKAITSPQGRSKGFLRDSGPGSAGCCWRGLWRERSAIGGRVEPVPI